MREILHVQNLNATLGVPTLRFVYNNVKFLKINTTLAET